MNLTDLLESKLNTACQTIGAVNSFGEYISSKFTSLANFMAGSGLYSSVYIPRTDDVNSNALARVSAEEYARACEEPDTIFSLAIRDGGSAHGPNDYVAVSGSQIVEAFEVQLSELRCQEQYLSYCLRSENPASIEFLTRVRALCPNIAGAVIEKYANLIELSGSPIDCLKNFLSLFKPGSMTYENQVISFIDYNDYTANILQSSFEYVVDTVSSFFDDVWRGVSDLGGFLTRLLESVVDLGKWAISMAFGSLNTIYEKGSSAAIGVLDLPLFQIHGTEEGWEALFDRNVDSTTYSWDGTSHSWSHRWEYQSPYPSLLHLIEDDIEGRMYDSVCEVVVPSNPCDISLRVGRTDGGRIVLTAHVVTDYGTWSKYSDEENNHRVFNSLRTALKFVSSAVPLVIDQQQVDDTSIKWTEITSLFIDHSSLDREILPRCLVCGATGASSLIPNDQLSNVIVGLITYMCLMSKGFYNDRGDEDTNGFLVRELYDVNRSIYTVDPEEADIITQLDATPFDLTRFNGGTFKPYAKRNQLPVTVHLQTNDERGQEVVSAMLKVIVSVVAVAATVKLYKWSSRRKQATALAHSRVERLAWEISGNPTAENLAEFNKAWNAARRMDFVNGILGLSTGSGTDTLSAAMGTVTSIIGSGTSMTSNALTQSSDIFRQSESIYNEVDDTMKLVKTVRDLIYNG